MFDEQQVGQNERGGEWQEVELEKRQGPDHVIIKRLDFVLRKCEQVFEWEIDTSDLHLKNGNITAA